MGKYVHESRFGRYAERRRVAMRRKCGLIVAILTIQYSLYALAPSLLMYAQSKSSQITPIISTYPVFTSFSLRKKISEKNANSSKKVTISRNKELHSVIATIFWIGENASVDNDYITNQVTEWDSHPVRHFGGIDDPLKRTKDFLPSSFTPLHNPYYFALPVSEFDDHGLIKQAREASIWSTSTLKPNESLFKGRWIKITRGDHVAYAQWVDSGPNEIKDYAYVFGSQSPKNTFGAKAGLDLSPAAALKLGFSLNQGSAQVTWEFISDKDIPKGPWSQFPPITNKIYWD